MAHGVSFGMQRRDFLRTGLALTATWGATWALPGRSQPAADAPAVARKIVVVQLYKPAPPDGHVAAAVAAIGALYDVDVVVADAVDLPPLAYTLKNKRWRAEKLLLHLEALRPPSAAAIVGLMASDISTTKGKVADWGIMGLGAIGGGVCVVSSHRVGRGAKKPEQTRQRFAKVVVHELGHAFGSEHCAVAGCLMNDAKGKVKTVDGERDYCLLTRLHLEGLKVPLAKKPTLPW